MKRDLQSLQELASSRGGKCLSAEYINSNTRYEWECKDGYRWFATLSSVQQGSWCPHCAGIAKKDLNWLHELAAKRGGKCLSVAYVNNRTKCEWECSEGHRWWATAGNIQQGYWCPYCVGLARKNIEHLHQLAAKNGGKCLSTEYINMLSHYLWECKEGHVWEATANSIQQGSWCPHCIHRHSKAELQIFDFVKQLYSDTINGQRQLLSNKKYELDIYIPSLKKAIEFDGDYWHSTDYAIQKDQEKSQQCQQVGIQLLRVKESDFIQNEQQVFDIIEKFLRP